MLRALPPGTPDAARPLNEALDQIRRAQDAAWNVQRSISQAIGRLFGRPTEMVLVDAMEPLVECVGEARYLIDTVALPAVAALSLLAGSAEIERDHANWKARDRYAQAKALHRALLDLAGYVASRDGVMSPALAAAVQKAEGVAAANDPDHEEEEPF